jgi:hypothetical protein
MDSHSDSKTVPEAHRNRMVDVPIKINAAHENGEITLNWTTDHSDAEGGCLTFRSPKRQMFHMRLQIQPNDIGLAFPENPLAAFWVGVDEAPSHPSYVRDYEPMEVSNDGQELLVLNINRSPANYCFAINFDSDVGPLRLISSTG